MGITQSESEIIFIGTMFGDLNYNLKVPFGNLR